ncbi:E3 UFM1-protein ligase 1-like protein [Drosera capensis]
MQQSVGTFIRALAAVAEESGLLIKRLDKKLERTLLHSYRQAYNKALQAPGRSMSVAVSHLKGQLDDAAYKILMDYHSATVMLLSLVATATGDDAEDA